MQKKCKQSMSVLISLLLCLNHFVVPAMAEEEHVPEITEEPVTEVIEETVEEEPSEVIETPDETLLEEIAPEEETEEVFSEIDKNDGEGSTETEESAEPLTEMSEEESEEKTESEAEKERENEGSEAYAILVDYSFTVSNNEVTITGYIGDDTEITLPSTIENLPVTAIGASAFKNKNNITSVEISEGVTSIGHNAFEGCSGLVSVQMPDTLISIGSGAFESCYNLTEIEIPKNVKTIDGYAFAYCSKLNSITIPESVTSLGGWVFSNCSKLMTAGPVGSNCNIEFGWQTRIPRSAFSGSSLNSITIPNGIKIIEDAAFTYCNNLTHVIIPESVEGMDEYTASYGWFADSKELKTAGPIGSDSNIEFGWKTIIPDNAFYKSKLTSIVLPSTITSIGSYAFYGCTNIEEIVLPEGLTKIENSTFNYCTKLTNINIPDSVIEIEDDAFYLCGSLSGVLYISANVEEIGFRAFAGCGGQLSGIVVDPANKNYYSGSNNVLIEKAHGYLLLGCDKSVIPENMFLRTIEEYAFYNCEKITDIKIPDGVKTIGFNAFAGCNSLTNITIPNSVETLRACFDSCTSLEKITLPQKLTEIESCMFQNCISLKSITIPDGVEKIWGHAFVNCKSLKSVTIPSSVTGIYWNAFAGCEALENGDVYYDGSVDQFKDIYMQEGNDLLFKASFHSTSGVTYGIKGKFNFYSSIKDVMSSDYYFDDNWFYSDATQYKHSLALMSLKMAMAGMAPDKKSAKKLNVQPFTDNTNILNLYKDLDFELTQSTYMIPGDNTIGYAIGAKNISGEKGDISLIAITIRSAGYEQEWAGNFNIGLNEYHQGFMSATQLVFGSLSDFIKKNSDYLNEDIKIWITGFSRGAAVANLLAAKLDNGEYTGVFSENINNNSVFAYCFECPKNTTSKDAHSPTFNNIFSICNSLDLVPRLAPSKWNFTRYGKLLPLASAENTDGYLSYKIEMVRQYVKLLENNSISNKLGWSNEKYVYDGLANEKVSQAQLLDELIDHIGKLGKSQENYVNNLEEYTMNIVRSKLAKSESVNLLDVLCEIYGLFETKALFVNYVKALYSTNYLEKQLACAQVRYLNDNIKKTFDLVIDLFVDGDEKLEGCSWPMVMRAHYPELCLAWLEAYKAHPEWDKNFRADESSQYSLYSTEEAAQSDDYEITESIFAPATNRLIKVNADSVDVEIFNEEGNLIAQIKDNEETEIEGGLNSYVNLNNQRVFIVPDDSECYITLTARAEELLSYICVEQDYAENKVNRVVAYTEKEIHPGDILSGTIENIADNSVEAQYVMADQQEVLAPTCNLQGDELSLYQVTLDIEGDGYAAGGGQFVPGEVVSLYVLDSENNFLGWYNNNELISEDLNYSFSVNDNKDITAKFKSFVYGNQLILSDNEIVLEKGVAHQLTASLLPETASTDNLCWYSDDESVAKVDNTGNISAIGTGTTTITVFTKYGSELSASCLVTVEGSGIYVKGLENNYKYTGGAINPLVSVYDNGLLLKSKTDYTITYKNTTKAYHVDDPEHPTATDKKKAPQIIIKSNSKGNYKGSKTIYFSIEPLDINDEQITVEELSIQAGTKPVSPVPVVYFNGKKLKAKTDYTVDYNGWNQLTPGDVTIKIHGKGNFQGTRDVTVHVAAQGMTSVAKLKVISGSVRYADLTGDFMTDFGSRITVKDGNTTLLKDVEYEIIEDSAKNYDQIGTCTFTIQGKGKYYGTRTVSVKITGTPLTDKKIKTVIPVYQYTGQEIELNENFAVLYDGGILQKDVDYVVENYDNNINAGKATAVLKGINRFTGTKKVTFTIAPVIAQLNENQIAVSDAVYEKSGAKAPVEIEGMTEGVDYTVKYKNNTKANTYGTLEITFKGNYKGTASVKRQFFIQPKDISGISVAAKDKVYSAKANAWKSAPVLTDTDGKKLKTGTDYEKEISYTAEDGSALPSVISAGTVVKVTVTGKGNYTGKASTTYRILNTGRDISKAAFKITPKEYTGSEVTLTVADITATINKITPLKLGTDYEIVSYTNNIKKGTAKVAFRGLGEYGGEKTVSFKIGQRSIVDYWQGVKDFFARMF